MFARYLDYLLRDPGNATLKQVINKIVDFKSDLNKEYLTNNNILDMLQNHIKNYKC